MRKSSAFGGLSDIGQVRSHNEDRWLADPAMGLYLVLDGLGGHAAGEVAAQMAIESFPPLLRKNLRGIRNLHEPVAAKGVTEAVRAMNQLVWNEQQTELSPLHGMGAAFVLALIWDNQALIAHMGDCRAYWVQPHEVTLLTKDHTPIQKLIDRGEITEEQARDHSASGQLSRFLGKTNHAVADTVVVDFEEGDQLLLCSDGLYGMLEPVEMEGILRVGVPPQQTCQLLVDAANLCGGEDNITAIVVAAERVETRGKPPGTSYTTSSAAAQAPWNPGARPSSANA